MTTAGSTVTVDCYVRAAPVGVPVEEVLDTLREYSGRGVIDDFALAVWPREISLAGYTEETPPVVRYRRFRSWAEEAGASLRPGFAVRERGSLVDDRTDAVLVLPECCLAVRVDGELTTVAPHRTGGTTYTVEDALADLVTLGRELSTRPSTADPTTDPDAIPTSAARPE